MPSPLFPDSLARGHPGQGREGERQCLKSTPLHCDPKSASTCSGAHNRKVLQQYVQFKTIQLLQLLNLNGPRSLVPRLGPSSCNRPYSNTMSVSVAAANAAALSDPSRRVILLQHSFFPLSPPPFPVLSFCSTFPLDTDFC